MDIEDYQWGIKQLRKDEEYVYDSMSRDIYFLGKVLGRKYNLLRISYSIFMYGFVVAVMAYSFVILYFPMPD